MNKTLKNFQNIEKSNNLTVRLNVDEVLKFTTSLGRRSSEKVSLNIIAVQFFI